MVDRDARHRFLSVSDMYLVGEINSPAFQDEVDSLETNDGTISDMDFQSWFFCNDLINHTVKLAREQSGYFQRLRLILASDAQIKRQAYWR